ncbi:MAG: PH domain-containing protein [Chloroflexaceae bacterium]|jgi:hypothetical protein|nr:PH domain-containing protein [Chloroflexaceae bacterium]
MSIEQTRAAVVGKIWQSIAQSGVDISAIPQERLNVLVNNIADGMLETVNDLLGEAQQAAGTPATPIAPAADGTAAAPGVEEQTLWEGRPFLALNESYILTSERVRIVRGMFSRDIEDIELFRLRDIDVSQAMGERMLNIGDLTLRSTDESDPLIVLRNIKSPQEVHELMRRAMLDARQRHRVGFREQI